MYLLSAHEMQTMDGLTIREFGLPGRVLMENAGRGATRVFLDRVYRRLPPAEVGMVAGRGNNGGDGFVMARYLAQQRIPVTVYLLAQADAVKGDAAANLNLLSAMAVPVVELPDGKAFEACRDSMRRPAVWIDAIFGTGLRSEVKGYFKEVIDFVNNLGKPIFSVDIPSGLDSDTGQPCGTSIRATATATFGFAKIGHLLYPGASYTGHLEIVEIGIPPHIAARVAPRQHLITSAEAAASLTARAAESHKGVTGHLLVIAGSTGKTGAAAMTALSAARAGAGLVTLAVAASLNPILETQVLEAMTCPLPEAPGGILGPSAMETILTLAEGKRCLALGPGIGIERQTALLVQGIVEKARIPMVLDADGLNCLAGVMGMLKKRTAPTVLTPHPGEMARLCGESVKVIQGDRIGQARRFAQEHNVHVVLKGARTVIARPDGEVFINPTGNPGMASGGMGDVLTGMIAGFIAQGYAPDTAARLGVYLHGAAADRLAGQFGPVGYLAGDLMARIPAEIGALISPRYPGLPVTDPLAYAT
jgi:hydroxyethylthiazole kinase-like uncharacterized protein yjeF